MKKAIIFTILALGLTVANVFAEWKVLNSFTSDDGKNNTAVIRVYLINEEESKAGLTQLDVYEILEGSSPFELAAPSENAYNGMIRLYMKLGLVDGYTYMIDTTNDRYAVVVYCDGLPPFKMFLIDKEVAK